MLVKGVDQVVCVDDGSDDNASDEIVKKLPKVNLLINRHNKGKSNTVERG